ncbi:MAG: hypothetical protein JNL82_29755 [Myxococcales bacterium]|nr:hypothetical protein [Myxococcales bacterium]
MTPLQIETIHAIGLHGCAEVDLNRNAVNQAAAAPTQSAAFDAHSADAFAALLLKIGACEPAREWCKGRSMSQAFADLTSAPTECKDDDWAGWFLQRWRRDVDLSGGFAAVRRRYPIEMIAADIARDARGDVVTVGLAGVAISDTVGGTATAGDGGTATAGYGGTATAGYRGTATAGDGGTATAGVGGTATAGVGGTATAGYGGTATAGYRGTATAGDGGTATAGVGGTATAGYGGTATAGDGGTISLAYWDAIRNKWRYLVLEVGENGIEANALYRLDADHRPVKVERPATPAAEAST